MTSDKHFKSMMPDVDFGKIKRDVTEFVDSQILTENSETKKLKQQFLLILSKLEKDIPFLTQRLPVKTGIYDVLEPSSTLFKCTRYFFTFKKKTLVKINKKIKINEKIHISPEFFTSKDFWNIALLIIRCNENGICNNPYGFSANLFDHINTYYRRYNEPLNTQMVEKAIYSY